MFDVLTLGLVIIFMGFILIIVSIVLSGVRRKGETEFKGGGVVMIGPIPIIFGSDTKWATLAIVLAIVLVVLGLLIYVI